MYATAKLQRHVQCAAKHLQWLSRVIRQQQPEASEPCIPVVADYTHSGCG
jgi:hypothetical protein